MKRIMYFLDFPFCVGGSNMVLLTQAYIMKMRGYQVCVVIPNDENGYHSSEYDLICQEYKLPVKEAEYSISVCMETIDIMDTICKYKAVFELVEGYKPELVHSTQINLTVELVARELKIPHLMNIYQTEKESFLLDWIKIYPIYHSADSIMFSKRWSEGLKIHSRCIRVAYNNHCLVKKNNTQDSINIISIGVLCERKKQLEIIKFVKRCCKEGIRVRLFLLGNYNTEYGNMCKKFVSENFLDDSVFFEGFVHDKDRYFQLADLSIVSSVIESYPGVIVECMANMVPVLSTPVAGVPELLRDGENGFLAEGYDENALYKAFKNFYRCVQENKIKSICSNAYSTYLEQHSYEVVGKNLEEYYKWIAADYKKRNDEQLRITDVKKIFSKDSWLYKENRRNYWYIYNLSRIIHNKKIAIWGAGHCGRIALEWIKCFSDSNEFVGYLDINKKGKILEYPIFKPTKELVIKCDIIIIAIYNINMRVEVMNMLEQYGKVRNRDYFFMVNETLRI